MWGNLKAILKISLVTLYNGNDVPKICVKSSKEEKITALTEEKS